MPPMFPINPAALPTVQTRKALMILDLQNDFVSPDGVLYAEEPEGFVGRILNLAKSFRDSGAGDVIWVRSEFEKHCSLLGEEDQIIAVDTMMRPPKAGPSRGRQPSSTVHDTAAMEADEEAFLSNDGKNDKKSCVRKGTPGADFASEVKTAMVAGRDIVFTKTHYSAFASGQQQLVQLLRGRFVTQLYVCGALTNISIYATALGAGQHGYDVTVVEDCCGFRSAMRHLNAVRQLIHLAGCEVVSSEAFLEQLESPPTSQPQSTGLSPHISKLTLQLGGGPPGAFPATEPRPTRVTPPTAAAPQPARGPRANVTPPGPGSSDPQSRPKAGANQRPSTDAGANRAASDQSPTESESTRRGSQKVAEARRNAVPATAAEQSELERSKGPIIPPPEVGGAEAEKPRVVNRPKRRAVRATADKKLPPPASIAGIPIRSKVSDEQTGKQEAQPLLKASGSVQSSDPKSPDEMAEQAAPVSSEPLCEGDTTIITNVLPPALAADAFERLLEEVSWAGMSHMGGEVPRRIAVQGAVADDGSMPVYRHPADESPPLLPFSPTVLQIKTEVEKHLGHELNHVLIQHYRSGNDYISEHSDKTLDIVPGSFIANVSLGAERTMIFRTKRPSKDVSTPRKDPSQPDSEASPTRQQQKGHSPPEDKTKDTAQQQEPPQHQPTPPPTDTTSTTPTTARQTIRAPLPHNSLCRMGLRTNAAWLHAIRQDRRADRDKSAAELAWAGARISLTFRRIGTFIDQGQGRIWGQGARCKTRGAVVDANEGKGEGEGVGKGRGRVVNGQTEEAVRMLKAFGAENNKGAGEFVWAEWYGEGFDVLHMGTPKRFFAAAAPPPAPATTVTAGGVADDDTAAAAAAAVALEREVINARVGLALAELGVSCAKGSVEGGDVRFEDNDTGRATVEGHASVLRYLDAVYGAGRRYDQMLPGEVARRFTRLQRGLDLLGKWTAARKEAGITVTTDTTPATGRGDKEDACHSWATEAQTKTVARLLKTELADWEAWAEEAAAVAAGDKPTSTDAAASETSAGNSSSGSFYIASGGAPSPADFALWPVLHDMVQTCGGALLGEHLRRYYAAFKARSAAAKVLGTERSE